MSCSPLTLPLIKAKTTKHSGTAMAQQHFLLLASSYSLSLFSLFHIHSLFCSRSHSLILFLSVAHFFLCFPFPALSYSLSHIQSLILSLSHLHSPFQSFTTFVSVSLLFLSRRIPNLKNLETVRKSVRWLCIHPVSPWSLRSKACLDTSWMEYWCQWQACLHGYS